MNMVEEAGGVRTLTEELPHISFIHSLALIGGRFVEATGPGGKPRHPSAAPPGGSRGVPRPDGVYDPSSESWF